MPQYTISVTDEELKALEWDLISPVAWLENMVHSKAMRAADAIIFLALDDATHTILTAEEKRQLVTTLDDLDIIINTVAGLPPSIKAAIIHKARIKTAAERDEEFGA